MRYIVGFSRIFVGVLFIISGLIKLNDPVGFSFKLEEYFSQGVLNMPSLMPWALSIAIIVVIIEVILGIALLLGYRSKLTIWSLLGMIVFFTFLTFYSAYYNKVTDCGCFGDAVKLTPWESFTKDVALLVLIVVLLLGIRYVKPLLSPKKNSLGLGIALLACIAFCYQVLNHLPAKDFRPYKIGANIEAGMNVPPDAPKPIYEYAWRFTVDGVEKIIVTNGDYPTVDGVFLDVKTTEIQKGYEPPIHDSLAKEYDLGFDFYFTDETTLKTIVRSNPAILVLEKGTITQKSHHNDLNQLRF